MDELLRAEWKRGWDTAWKVAEKHHMGSCARWAATGAAIGGWITVLIIGWL